MVYLAIQLRGLWWCVCVCVRACLDRGRLGGVVRSQPARWRMIYTSSLAATPGRARRYKGCASGPSVQCCQLSRVIETRFVKLTLNLEVISACFLSRSRQCVSVLCGTLLISAKYHIWNYDSIVEFYFRWNPLYSFTQAQKFGLWNVSVSERFEVFVVSCVACMEEKRRGVYRVLMGETWGKETTWKTQA